MFYRDQTRKQVKMHKTYRESAETNAYFTKALQANPTRRRTGPKCHQGHGLDPSTNRPGEVGGDWAQPRCARTQGTGPRPALRKAVQSMHLEAVSDGTYLKYDETDLPWCINRWVELPPT